MSENTQHIVVVGGGSAGWLSACFIAASQNSETTTVTLIESPNIPTLGVGEGTWPSMRNTLNTIGIPEAQFLSVCNASFKQGSKFVGWRDGTDSYYHPFMVPGGYNEINLAAHWQAHYSGTPYDYTFCPQPEVCDHFLAPKQLATPDYAFVTNYGYHFDAGKLTALLTEHGVNNLGIRHVVDDVIAIHAHPSRDIQGLETRHHEILSGDMFIDCSGMRGLLIHGHYQIPWHRVGDTLLNDSAVASQVKYADDNAPIQSTTIATAQPAGWTWDIGLYHRRGVGLSYASSHLGKEAAEETLAKHIESTGASTDEVSMRHLSFTPGYRTEFWYKNCLAIGMSAGFIEPLEASALAMVELSLAMLTEEFPQNRAHMEMVSKRFNKRFDYRWQRVIDFVKLHYVLSERSEDYWLAQRAPETLPDALKDWLALWQYQAPSRHDFIENEEVFSSTSYQFVLYGMQFKTRFGASATPPAAQKRAHRLHTELQQHQQKLLAALPTNRDYLATLRQHLSQHRNTA